MSESADKKFNRIVFHVGPDKTGSTAIQNALFQNRSFLLTKGVMYSSGQMLNDKLLRMHFLNDKHLASILSGTNQSDDGVKAKSNRYIKRLKDEIAQSNATELILSHEGFVHLDTSELSELQGFLMGFTDNIEIIFYVREPVAYAKSAMSQRVKTGRHAWGINPPYIRYRQYLSNLVTVFGKEQVKPRVYSRELFPGGDVVRDFLSFLPITEAEQLSIVDNTNFKGNPSLPHKGLWVGDRVVALLGKQIPSANQFKEIFVPELMAIGEGKIKLSKRQVHELDALSLEHTQFLKDTFAITLEPKKSERYEDSVEAFSDRELTQLAMNVIYKVMPQVVPKKHYFSLDFLSKWLSPIKIQLNKIRDKGL